jgi:hypothetical protein
VRVVLTVGGGGGSARAWPGEVLARHLLFPTGDFGFRRIRGAVGLGHRLTVYKRTLSPVPRKGLLSCIVNSK